MGQVVAAVHELVQLHSRPVGSLVAVWETRKVLTTAPVARTFPSGSPLNVAEFRQVPMDRIAENGDEKVSKRIAEGEIERRTRHETIVALLPSLLGRAFVLVQGILDAIGQFRPIGVQATFPARRVAAEEPLLVVRVRPDAITAFALTGTDAGLLQFQILDQMAPERRPTRLLDVKKDDNIPAEHIKLGTLAMRLVEGDVFDLRT